jgi:hypothetical protein
MYCGLRDNTELPLLQSKWNNMRNCLETILFPSGWLVIACHTAKLVKLGHVNVLWRSNHAAEGPYCVLLLDYYLFSINFNDVRAWQRYTKAIQ